MAKSSSSSSAFVATSFVMPLAALVVVLLLSITASTANAASTIEVNTDNKGGYIVGPVLVKFGDRLHIRTADASIEEFNGEGVKKYMAVDGWVLTEPMVGSRNNNGYGLNLFYRYESPTEAGPYFAVSVYYSIP